MAKGFSGMPGGNMQQQAMKQLQKMQKQMAQTQEDLENMTLEASSGGGAVKVLITGKKVVKDIIIKPEVVDPDDVEMLQDLLISAVNEALRQAEEHEEREMKKVTGGMNIPGLF